MTFDDDLYLLKEELVEDEIGDMIPTITRQHVFCSVQSITRSEHYLAAGAGMKPEIVFVINKHDYQGEKEVEFENEVYKVTRTFIPKEYKNIGDFDTIELICQKKVIE